MADAKITGLTELAAGSVAAGDLLAVVDVSDTTQAASGSTKKVRADSLGVHLVNVGLCQGRLTTESGVPISTADRTAQSTLYWTPSRGNRISLFDGTAWRPSSSSEISLALSGLTSGKNYDVFVYNNSGTLTLELSAAWTNDTTRADALAVQDGIYVKSGATTRRYLGTIRTTGTTTTEDSLTKRFVWNLYNQAMRSLQVTDTTSSWTYSTATWRQARGQAANRVEVVVGISGAGVSLDVWAIYSGDGAGSQSTSVGLGLDSTTAPAAGWAGGQGQTNTVNAVFPIATYRDCLAPGYHALNWLEKGHGSATQTWFGSDSGAYRKPGLNGFVEG
jgi:hypothetical protein